MLHPYPNQLLLGIVDGRRPPVLPPADVDWSKGLPHIPTAEEAAREAGEWADRTLKGPQLPQSQQARDRCIIPGLLGGCLIDEDTGTLLGVNALLVLALLIGGLMLLVPVAAKGVTIVTGTTPMGHVRRAIRERKKKRARGYSPEDAPDAQKEAPSGE